MAAKVLWAEEMFALVEQLPGMDVREYGYDGTQVRLIILPKGCFLKTLNGRVLWGALACRTREGSWHPDYRLTNRLRKIYENDHSYRTVGASQVLSLWWEGELPD